MVSHRWTSVFLFICSSVCLFTILCLRVKSPVENPKIIVVGNNKKLFTINLIKCTFYLPKGHKLSLKIHQ